MLVMPRPPPTGGYDSIYEAAQMGKCVNTLKPIPENVQVYEAMYQEYVKLHDYGRGETTSCSFENNAQRNPREKLGNLIASIGTSCSRFFTNKSLLPIFKA